MNDELKRYNLFGWDYEMFNPLSQQGIDWHLKWARITGGPILELACGTGRLLKEIACEGYEIDGIDLSQNMINLAWKQLNRLPKTTRYRIRLLQLDMSKFHLGRKYPLIYITDNSFRELKSTEKQLSCLKCVYDHLDPGGKFLMTERQFDTSQFVNGRLEIPKSKPVQNPETGEYVSRKIDLSLTKGGTWIEGVMIYHITQPDGTDVFDNLPFNAPLLSVDDYLELFSKSGLGAEVYFDYKKNIPGEGKRILCFVCTKVN